LASHGYVRAFSPLSAPPSPYLYPRVVCSYEVSRQPRKALEHATPHRILSIPRRTRGKRCLDDRHASGRREGAADEFESQASFTCSLKVAPTHATRSPSTSRDRETIQIAEGEQLEGVASLHVTSCHVLGPICSRSNPSIAMNSLRFIPLS
jgi:hypothetical protein